MVRCRRCADDNGHDVDDDRNNDDKHDDTFRRIRVDHMPRRPGIGSVAVAIRSGGVKGSSAASSHGHRGSRARNPGPCRPQKARCLSWHSALHTFQRTVLLRHWAGADGNGSDAAEEDAPQGSSQRNVHGPDGTHGHGPLAHCHWAIYSSRRC